MIQLACNQDFTVTSQGKVLDAPSPPNKSNLLRVSWQFNELCVAVCPPDENGIYPVYVPRLPGAVSQGSTEQEALENITEAVIALIATYQAENMEIPWATTLPDIVQDEQLRRIAIRA